MNLSTVIAVLALAAIVGAALRHIYKTRQNGGCCCSSGCSSCSCSSCCSSCRSSGSITPGSVDQNSCCRDVSIFTADPDDEDSRDTSIRQ